jgi:hypothetical protein
MYDRKAEFSLCEIFAKRFCLHIYSTGREGKRTSEIEVKRNRNDDGHHGKRKKQEWQKGSSQLSSNVKKQRSGRKDEVKKVELRRKHDHLEIFK